MFKNCRLERGEPNTFFVVRLDSPTFSSGIRKKMIAIKRKLISVAVSFNIFFIYPINLYYNYSSISNTSLKILLTLLPESIVSNGSFRNR